MILYTNPGAESFFSFSQFDDTGPVGQIVVNGISTSITSVGFNGYVRTWIIRNVVYIGKLDDFELSVGIEL